MPSVYIERIQPRAVFFCHLLTHCVQMRWPSRSLDLDDCWIRILNICSDTLELWRGPYLGLSDVLRQPECDSRKRAVTVEGINKRKTSEILKESGNIGSPFVFDIIREPVIVTDQSLSRAQFRLEVFSFSHELRIATSNNCYC